MTNLDHLIWLPDQKTLSQQKIWIKTQLKKLGKAKINQLIKAAVQVSRQAHPPYSHYKVGAAILCRSGKIYASCNAEVISLSDTDHAESSAITQAISQGEVKKSGNAFIKAVVVAHRLPSGPCGACRQRIHQHCKNCLYIDITLRGKIKRITSLKILNPYPFCIWNIPKKPIIST